MNIDFDDDKIASHHPSTRTTSIAGRDQKSDVLVKLEITDNPQVTVELESTVFTLFGKQIDTVVRSTLQQLQVTQMSAHIQDNGALDFVIQARVEAAARHLIAIRNLGVLPGTPKETEKVKDRLRRTRLYLPGNNPDFMLNAGLFGPDCIILDLEDSVAPDDKLAARILVRNALVAVDFAQAEKIVRINPITSPFGNADLAMIVPACPDVILIPKCESANDVTAVEEIVTIFEQKNNIRFPIQLMPLIESAKGVLNANSIAKASVRNVALCFGAEDFAADLGVVRSKDGKENYFARSVICLAAKAAKIQALDSVYSDIEDIPGLTASTRESIQMGFDGKGVIHPSQIGPIHDAFLPTNEQIEYSRKVIAAFEDAKTKGSGVAVVGSKMIDAPVLASAKKILAVAESMGAYNSPQKDNL
jgi:citrate lyase subunit beta / citryl-CoA lyase